MPPLRPWYLWGSVEYNWRMKRTKDDNIYSLLAFLLKAFVLPIIETTISDVRPD